MQTRHSVAFLPPPASRYRKTRWRHRLLRRLTYARGPILRLQRRAEIAAEVYGRGAVVKNWNEQIISAGLANKQVLTAETRFSIQLAL